MALIDHQTTFDLNLIDNQIVGIAAQVGRHDSGLHKHNKDQLLYAPFGCMNITLDSQKLLLPQQGLRGFLLIRFTVQK